MLIPEFQLFHESDDSDRKREQLLELIYTAMVEVSSAITTALATTIVGFLPVFAMQAAEGKLFHPLAFTKTFALQIAFVLLH